ncbi:WAP, Kazal, immunoglobulin, Kunitz and NTR domain-containing protein isoform X1 [Plutella xylostella]|uniref:WAP, Kazal, immunoglobulin, Kunitz and NTR domain-containing protein isoform X1 n=1 Tax=Plutella xylostella TaxID=51655 RepID=UPI0020331883|nr:WAP, Kazal, immunoglobulin, Kunitz and NTR domain-containing protein isoform X1 [Plutella xylostella]XP_048484321.1 WAP, Kazal, immunoglobulin, Kunitz and NTR domain-containing protein isoform X1 [Plutella xylostella]
MGKYTMIILAAMAVAFIFTETDAAGSCPLPSKTFSCSPKCKEQYDCSHGRLCCPNSCNAKSCVEPAGNSGAGGKDKYSSGGPGSYCDNVKCNSFEVCKPDASGRKKCQRA